MLRNEGKGADGVLRFTDVAMAVGADDDKDGRGLAVADFDNDGALDLVINNNPGDTGTPTVAPTFLRNNVGARRNWLAGGLGGVRCNRDASGAGGVAGGDAARHRARPHLAKQLRLVSAGCSYASQHSARLYFGLDDVRQVNRLTVRWPGGGEETFRDVHAGQLARITQGKGIVCQPLPPKVAAKAHPGR